MSTINIPSADSVPAASKPLLQAVHQQLGVVPNLMKLVGNSPAALEGYLSLNGALAKGKLDIKLRESIALTTAEYNGCDYCLSAHAYLGEHVAKLSASDIAGARDAAASDPRTRAALQFALRVAASRGRVTETEVAQLRGAGFGDGEIVEIVATVALNVLTNYVNNVAQTEIDFPRVNAQRPS
jgi:uncharacterized peroxidase-related enzyme